MGVLVHVLPPGPMGCISRFIWTFQCLTLVLACRSFRWAACEETEERDEPALTDPDPGPWAGVSLTKPGLEAPSGTETQLTLL